MPRIYRYRYYTIQQKKKNPVRIASGFVCLLLLSVLNPKHEIYISYLEKSKLCLFHLDKGTLLRN